MLNISSININSEQPKELAEFYAKVADKKPDWEEGDYIGFSFGDAHIMIGPHSEVKGKSQNPQRIIIFFETKDVNAEFERLKNIGAEEIAKPYKPDEKQEFWLATLADPDGNYFQLATPWKE